MKLNARAWLLLLCGVSLLSGCSGAQSRDAQPQTAGGQSDSPDYVHMQPASGALIAALDRSAAQLISGQDLPERVVSGLNSLLGPLPTAPGSRSVSAAEQTSYILGKDAYSASANTSDTGNSKDLPAPNPGISFAVYEFPAIQAGDNLSTLYVENSQQQFSGKYAGFWICFANYETGRWEMINRTTLANYRRVLSKTTPYLSPASSFYVALLVVDGQSVRIDRVGLGVSSTWTRLVLEDGSNSGWTPAVVMDQFASVHAAYANHATGDPQYAYCLGTDDPLDFGNWNFSAIDTQAAGQANWLDIIMDPVAGRPAVSYVYTGLGAPEGNSQVVLANLVDHPTLGVLWANYGFYSDGAEYSSLDMHAPDGAFGFIAAVRNENSAPKKAYDLEYRYWDLNVPWDASDNGSVSKLSGFGEGLFFPHLGYKPVTGEAALQADGGLTLVETGVDTWLPIYDEESEHFGSLRWMPAGISSATAMGSTYAQLSGGSSRLMYVSFDAAQFGTAEEVDSIPASGGAWIGGSSELAFLRNGDPVIAYSVYDGSTVQIKYARKTGTGWVIETVSGLAGDDPAPQTVLVDIATEPAELFFEPTGRVVIIYNSVISAATQIEIAVKYEELG